ncbi:hypothetical protein [Sphingomonas sp. SRS2]|uniref:hypothetical protein n=1 Tax=Sphingomonas sp. SRS2 TaxID=133190 RepID=UPI00128E2764|nr:hypothetical protein [Sphingomonas sp. SRS2]
MAALLVDCNLSLGAAVAAARSCRRDTSRSSNTGNRACNAEAASSCTGRACTSSTRAGARTSGTCTSAAASCAGTSRTFGNLEVLADELLAQTHILADGFDRGRAKRRTSGTSLGDTGCRRGNRKHHNRK